MSNSGTAWTNVVSKNFDASKSDELRGFKVISTKFIVILLFFSSADSAQEEKVFINTLCNKAIDIESETKSEVIMMQHLIQHHHYIIIFTSILYTFSGK